MLLALLLLAAPLDDARSAYVAADYDGALAIADGALADPTLPASERARLTLLRGVSLAQMGDAEGATASFDRALALDACASLPVAPPEDTRALFVQARARAAACTRAPVSSAASSAWPLAAGVGVAASGGVVLVAGAAMGALAAATNASANAAPVQNDAVLLDAASRDQANVANALYALGAVLVVGGAATTAIAVALE